ncbi:MAG: YjhX family toxin [Parvularculaceae bacterium]
MNISKPEQRTLHVLARGGTIAVEKCDAGKIIAVNCISREGWTLADCSLGVFQRLKRKRLIASSGGDPYQITRLGRRSVRSQLDNRA